VLHDWLNIPGWTHGRQVQQVIGRGKLLVATLINAVFPGVAVFFVLYFWSRPKPALVTNYWLLYCAVTVGSAVAMWYVPYFRGAGEKTCQNYTRMYAGTRQVLPARNNNPRPNLLHICFHLLFLVNLGLSLIVFLGR
jgi:hypothetical protein